MKELMLLTKTFFKTSLDISRKKGKQVGSYIYLIGIGLVFAILTGLFSFFFYSGLIGQGMPRYAMVVTCLVFLSFLGLILNFFSMYTALFKAKDFDFLASIPVKKSNIIMGKLASLFLYSLITDGIAMIPVIIFYMVNGGTVVGFFSALVGTILAGVIPLLLATLIGAIVGVISAKFKHGETIGIIVYIVLFIGFAIVVGVMANENFIAESYKVLPYYYFLNDSFASNNGWGLLWFTLINIGASILVIIFTSLIYFPINQIQKNNGDGSYVSKKEKTGFTTNRILFKKEVNMVTKNVTFLLSTYAMPLIMLVLGIAIVGFIGSGFFDNSEKTINGVLNQLNYIQPAIFILIASICVTTYASFSMEGRDNLEQLFVYPLDKEKIITSKVKASVIPMCIALLISGALLILPFAIILGFDKIPVFTWINIIVLPPLASVIGSLVGTLCGLKWIKLDFVEPNDVLKKSKSMGFTVLFSILINLVIYIGVCILNFVLPTLPFIGFIVGVVLDAIAIIILSIAVHKNGVKMLEKALIK